MEQTTAGNVGVNTKHYLEVIDKFRDDPDCGYHYHHWVVSCQLLGPVDRDTFEAILHEIANASPVLRSFFENKSGVWQQVVLPSLEKGFFTYRKHEAGTDWRAVIGELTQQLNEQVLPVEQAPIFKVFLQEFDDVTIVTLHIHHLLVDGWGMFVLFQQLVSSYEAALNGQSSPLPLLDESEFLAIAKRDENQWADLSDRQEKLDWWKKQLGNHAYVTDPLPEPSGYLDLCLGHLSPEVSKAVMEYSDRKGMHYSYVIQAAYIKALQDWAGIEDILLTTTKANRSDETGTIIANLAHWMIGHPRVPRKIPIREVAQIILNDTAKAKEHYLPYWDIVKEICPQQYSCNFGITPFSFNFLPPVAKQIESGGAVSLRPLFEFFAFSPRVVATEFYLRCLTNTDPETNTEIISCDLGFKREVVEESKAREALDQITQEISDAFN